jgi:hypothetical protein
MSVLQMLILAIAVMTGLVALRLARVHLGRTPHPERMVLFLLVLTLVPPILLGVLAQPSEDQLRGVKWVPLYGVILAGLAILMGIAAFIIRRVVRGQSRSQLILALVGSEADPDDLAIDPPLTAKLAEGVALVDKTNAVFPRGRDFPTQIDRPGFRVDWDALDAATVSLEDRILSDKRLGIAVASSATAMAEDARARLDTLRGLAVDQGRAWPI